MNPTPSKSLWRRVPELWIVVLPLVMAVVMGTITLSMALKYPDQAIIRGASSPTPASIKAQASEAESGRAESTRID
ncbi:MAG: hypothetical protein KDI37_17535 [Xanthomonadales bacterium]|nr:hypothetical protein [Xanthomonadales bacterium]MCB1643537.1 hypothetical protein [Xanthomonadales bacterium]